MLRLVSAFLLLAAFREATAPDYCQEDLCQPGIIHIACRNYGEFDESCGSEAVILKIPTPLRAHLLDALNDFRNKVALGKYPAFKPAARMATLQWHDELAGLAMFALRRCGNMDDYCTNTDEFNYVSYIYGSTQSHQPEKPSRAVVDIVLQFWMDDIKSCTMSHINGTSIPKDSLCKGYFTQMVQDLAGHVGCALMRRRNQASGLYLYGLLCHFSRGKLVNELVYRDSTQPGNRCQAGTHSTYQGLCALEEHVNPNALQLGSLN